MADYGARTLVGLVGLVWVRTFSEESNIGSFREGLTITPNGNQLGIENNGFHKR